MKILREILNVLIGIAVMISLLVGIPSLIAVLNGHNQNIQEAAIVNFVLVASLICAYFLNKPKHGSILQSFYKAKWLTAISTLIVTSLSLVVFFMVSILGMVVSSGVLIILLKFIVGRLWKCPACSNKLPYLSRGKSGFSIKECPSCGVVLAAS